MLHESVPRLTRRMPVRTAARRATLLVVVWGSATGALMAQNTNAQAPAAPAPLPAGGRAIGVFSDYAVYYSSFSPTGVSASSSKLPSDLAAGGSIVINWTKFTERSSFSLIYTPSYTGYVRNFSLNALN